MVARAIQSKIHIARQQLGLDDETYRALLERVAGVSSSTQLTDHTGGAVLRELERLGFKPRTSQKTRGKPHNFSSRAMPEMMSKIEAQLADMGLAWSYADGIAKQMFGIQRCAWVRQPKQLKAIIAALHKEQDRRGLLEIVEGLMADLDKVVPNWRDDLEELPKGWQRHIPTLARLADDLCARRDAHFEGDDLP